MKKKLLAAMCSAVMLLAACGSNGGAGSTTTQHVTGDLVREDFTVYEGDTPLKEAGYGEFLLEENQQTARGVALGSSAEQIARLYPDIFCGVRYMESTDADYPTSFATLYEEGIEGEYAVLYSLSLFDGVNLMSGEVDPDEITDRMQNAETHETFTLTFHVVDDIVEDILLETWGN